MMEMMREVRNAELAGVGHPGGNPELHSALAASHLLNLDGVDGALEQP